MPELRTGTSLTTEIQTNWFLRLSTKLCKRIQRGVREAALFRNGCFRLLQCGNFFLDNLLCGSNDTFAADTVFQKILVKVIEMLGADVRDPHMTDLVKIRGSMDSYRSIVVSERPVRAFRSMTYSAYA